MTTETTPTQPKEKAKTLLATYAAKVAVLTEATASYRTQITEIQAALTKATTTHQAELEAMEEELKQLALDHAKEIFGDDTRSLVENGYILQLRSTTAVLCEDEEAAIRDLANLAETAQSEDARLAAQACIRTRRELDREIISKMIISSPDWFAVFGIALVSKDSATVKPRPAPKPKAAKKTKAKGKTDQPAEVTADQPLIQETA